MTPHTVPGTVPPKAVPGRSRLRAGAAGMYRRLIGGGQAGAVARVMAFRALTLLMNLATGVFVAGVLGPDGRGELAALLLAPQTVSALCLFGLPTAFIYYAKSDPAHADRYFGQALLLTLPGTCVAAAITWAIMPFWLGGHGADIIGVARLLLWSLPFSVMIPLLSGVLDAHGRFGLASAIQYLQPLGCAVLLLPLISFGLLTPTSAAVAYTAPVLLSCGVAAWQAVRLLRPAPTIAAPFRPRLLRYGLKRYGFEVLATVSAFLDQLLVVHLLSPASTGAYAVALSISRVLGVMQDAVFSVVFPGLAGRPVEEVMAVLGRAIRISTALAAAAAALLALLGPEVIALLYGPSFAVAVTPFRLLLAATVIQGLTRLLSHGFAATGRPGPLMAIEGVGIGVMLLSASVLVPRFGVDGAAGMALLGSLGRLVGTFACWRLVLNVPVPRLIISKDDLVGVP